MSQSLDMQGLERIDRVSVREMALDRLKRYIFTNALEPGQRLPPERELAERLGIGRPSVREALKALEAVGLVESRVGEGTFLTLQSGVSIGRTIGINLAAWGSTIIEIHVARQIVEVECARVAAQQATSEDLAALEKTLIALEETGRSFKEYLTADMQFHRLIAHATHNTIIAYIIDNLITLLEETIHEGHADLLPQLEEGVSTHRLLFTKIAQHEPEAAAETMRQHLQFSTELWQAITSIGSRPNA